MLLLFKYLKKDSKSFGAVIARLDRAIQRKKLDYPVKPDNDNHWNRVLMNMALDYFRRESYNQEVINKETRRML